MKLRRICCSQVTFGAIDAHAQDLWSFSDGTGALSLDVSLPENYAMGLSFHADGHDQGMRRWPMDWNGAIVYRFALFYACFSTVLRLTWVYFGEQSS